MDKCVPIVPDWLMCWTVDLEVWFRNLTASFFFAPGTVNISVNIPPPLYTLLATTDLTSVPAENHVIPPKHFPTPFP